MQNDCMSRRCLLLSVSADNLAAGVSGFFFCCELTIESLEFFFAAGLGGLSNGANTGSGSGANFDIIDGLLNLGERGSPIGDEAAEFIIGDEAAEYIIGDDDVEAVVAVVAGVAKGSKPINECERPYVGPLLEFFFTIGERSIVGVMIVDIIDLVDDDLANKDCPGCGRGDEGGAW